MKTVTRIVCEDCSWPISDYRFDLAPGTHQGLILEGVIAGPVSEEPLEGIRAPAQQLILGTEKRSMGFCIPCFCMRLGVTRFNCVPKGA